jgi:hypothetical protein
VCLIKHYTTRTYGRVLNFSNGWRGVVTFTPPEEHISSSFRIEEEAKKKAAEAGGKVRSTYSLILKMEAIFPFEVSAKSYDAV